MKATQYTLLTTPIMYLEFICIFLTLQVVTKGINISNKYVMLQKDKIKSLSRDSLTVLGYGHGSTWLN